MASLAPLNEAEIKQFVEDWYKALDVHAPVDDVAPMVATEGLEMVFPEATLHTVDEFKGWYHAVTHRFFDEVHVVKDTRVTLEGDRAPVKVLVNWQARFWNAPDRNSQWLGFDAYQSWVVVRSPQTQKPVIQFYGVDKLDPMEGSASL